MLEQLRMNGAQTATFETAFRAKQQKLPTVVPMFEEKEKYDKFFDELQIPVSKRKDAAQYIKTIFSKIYPLAIYKIPMNSLSDNPGLEEFYDGNKNFLKKTKWEYSKEGSTRIKEAAEKNGKVLATGINRNRIAGKAVATVKLMKYVVIGKSLEDKKLIMGVLSEGQGASDKNSLTSPIKQTLGYHFFRLKTNTGILVDTEMSTTPEDLKKIVEAEMQKQFDGEINDSAIMPAKMTFETYSDESINIVKEEIKVEKNKTESIDVSEDDDDDYSEFVVKSDAIIEPKVEEIVKPVPKVEEQKEVAKEEEIVNEEEDAIESTIQERKIGDTAELEVWIGENEDGLGVSQIFHDDNDIEELAKELLVSTNKIIKNDISFAVVIDHIVEILVDEYDEYIFFENKEEFIAKINGRTTARKIVKYLSLEEEGFEFSEEEGIALTDLFSNFK